MGAPLPDRVCRAGPYRPSASRGGSGDDGAFRMDSVVVRGTKNSFYWEGYLGEGDLNETLTMVALTGTLNIAAGSTTVAGVGTLFLAECHLGQTIIGVKGSKSYLLKPRRIISNTSMVVWGAPADTDTGLTGQRMHRLFAINDQRGTALWGNALKLNKGSFIGVGEGVFRVNGAALSASWTLARAPSLCLFNPTTGAYTNFPLGMPTSAAPTLAAVGSGTKDMQAGSYSLVITPARKQTGGYNNPSLRADVTIATNDRIQITFPAMNTASGQNSWKVWVTTFADSLGADLNYLNGPWHFYIEVDDTMVSSAGGTFTIEYLDAEVEGNELVSFNNDAPTDAEFVALLNDAPVWISCQGQGNATTPTQSSPGPFIVPAKPNNIEAAPLELAFSTSPPETILGVMSMEGRLYLSTVNYLQIAQSTPDESIPILIRPFWYDGFTGPDQLVGVNGHLYGYPVAGPSRSVGDGDVIEAEREWAADVSEITDTWNPGHVLVGYDPHRDMVCFVHAADRLNTAGFWTSRILGFGISQNAWIFDRTITSEDNDCIVSGIATVGDRMELLLGGRVADVRTRRLNGGTGAAYFIVPPVSDSGSGISKVIKPASVKGKVTSASLQVFTYDVGVPVVANDLVTGTNSASGTIALSNTTQVAQSERKSLNCPNAVLHTIRVAGTSSTTPDKIESISYEQAIQGVRR